MLSISDEGVQKFLNLPPPQTTCWICFEEGADNAPLVKDCSCRGSTGYAHVKCLAKYAREKAGSVYRARKSYGEFLSAWNSCPLCKQDYQYFVGLFMAKEMEPFLEQEMGEGIPECSLPALERILEKSMNIMMDKKAAGVVGDEAKRAGNKLISLYGRDVDSPDFTKSQPAFACLGQLAEEEGNLKLALAYHKKGRECARRSGNQFAVHQMETKIKILENRISGHHASHARSSVIRSTKYTKGYVEDARKIYDNHCRRHGGGSTHSIDAGINLADALLGAGHGIEAEKLYAKFAKVSHQFHGEQHQLTVDSKKALKNVKERKVRELLLHGGGGGRPGILTNEKYLVQDIDEANACYVVSELDGSGRRRVPFAKAIICERGTPVVCTGLKNAPHLNGKIGDVRGFDLDMARHTVHFADKSLKPARVKGVNLRIVFDLPDE